MLGARGMIPLVVLFTGVKEFNNSQLVNRRCEGPTKAYESAGHQLYYSIEIRDLDESYLPCRRSSERKRTVASPRQLTKFERVLKSRGISFDAWKFPTLLHP
jgi:hypothetical protein